MAFGNQEMKRMVQDIEHLLGQQWPGLQFEMLRDEIDAKVAPEKAKDQSQLPGPFVAVDRFTDQVDAAEERINNVEDYTLGETWLVRKI